MPTPAHELPEIRVLEKVLISTKELIPNLRFDALDASELYPALLYASTWALANNIFTLIQKDEGVIGVPVLFRTLMEAHVDLLNACKDPDYVNTLDLKNQQQWKTFLEEAFKGNQYFAGIAQDPDAHDMARQHKRAIDLLKGKHGVKDIDISEKFEKAGMADEHRAVYGICSGHSHNNIGALIDRHIRIGDDGRPIVAVFQPWSDASMHAYAGMTVELLARSTELIHEFLKSDTSDGLSELRRHVEEARELAEVRVQEQAGAPSPP